jgi:hypothetical protein
MPARGRGARPATKTEHSRTRLNHQPLAPASSRGFFVDHGKRFAVPAIPPAGERMGQQTVGCVIPDELGLGKLPAVTSVPRWSRLSRLLCLASEACRAIEVARVGFAQ